MVTMRFMILAAKFMVHDSVNFIKFLFKFNFFWHLSSLGFVFSVLYFMELTILLDIFIKVCSHQKKRMQKWCTHFCSACCIFHIVRCFCTPWENAITLASLWHRHRDVQKRVQKIINEKFLTSKKKFAFALIRCEWALSLLGCHD